MSIFQLEILQPIQNLTYYKKYFILSSLLIALYTAWTWKNIQYQGILSQDHLHRGRHNLHFFLHFVTYTFTFLNNKFIFSKNKNGRRGSFQKEERTKKGNKDRNTCSLETTWTGPMFTDTYLPLVDNLCFTHPCKPMC